MEKINIRKQMIIVSVYRMLAVLLCFIGLIEQGRGMQQPHVMLYFFTILTNILCALFFLFAVILQKNAPAMEGGLTTSILLVMLVFHFILLPTSDFYQDEMGLNNLILHYIMPGMVMIDFLLFQKKANLRWYHPFYWSIIPIAYLGFVYIRAVLGEPFFTGYGMSSYPYFFLDVQQLGLTNVMICIGVLLIFYLVLGYVVLGLHYLIHRKRT